MKSRNGKSQTAAGYTLIEVIVYLAVFASLLGLALGCFFACYDHWLDTRRRSDDITRAMRAGEIWRQDVRTATAGVHFSAADQTLFLPHRDGEIAYRFKDATVLRQAKANAQWTVLLPRVKSSVMESDARKLVEAWRWEVELESRKKSARLHPVFTFIAATPAVPSP